MAAVYVSLLCADRLKEGCGLLCPVMRLSEGFGRQDVACEVNLEIVSSSGWIEMITGLENVLCIKVPEHLIFNA